MNSSQDRMFRMDRTAVKQFSDFKQSDEIRDAVKPLTPEEGLLAVEFLRSQWLEKGEKFPVMDRKYFEYR